MRQAICKFTAYSGYSRLVVDYHRRFAGSDTTAIALRSIFYHLCKYPRVYQTAVRELESTPDLSDPITFDQGQRLTYIQACIKEGLRLQPAVGMLLERLVPKEGATLDGVFFPAGTIVGINPWVVALDKNVYGQDAEEFRPERWLEASVDEHRMMERSFLAVSTSDTHHRLHPGIFLLILLPVWGWCSDVFGQKYLAFRDYQTRPTDFAKMESGTLGSCLRDELHNSLVREARRSYLQSTQSKIVRKCVTASSF
jgi:hypothetical protein